MSDLRAAAQMAIDLMLRDRNALYECHSIDGGGVPVNDPACAELMEYDDAIAVLRAALDAPEVEPVAWMVYTLDGESVCVTDNPANFTSEHRALPLYTAPPQRKPLTDEEIGLLTTGDGWSHLETPALALFARVIEQTHGIGGET